MAANFWTSGHWTSLTTRARLGEAHVRDQDRGLTNVNVQRVKVYLYQYLTDIAKVSQQLIRQRVVSTAMVYFRRFYLLHNFCDYDPRHIAPACLYVACKSEESQIQAKLLFQLMRKLSGKYPFIPILEMFQLLDLEMALLEELDSNLVVFSPYRDIISLLEDASCIDMAATTWAVLNDSYRTDICLLYPPFLIAVACMIVAAAYQNESAKLKPWLEGLNIDFAKVCDALQEIIAIYPATVSNMSAEDFNRCMELVQS